MFVLPFYNKRMHVMFNALSHLANIGHFWDDIFTGPMTQTAAPKL